MTRAAALGAGSVSRSLVGPRVDCLARWSTRPRSRPRRRARRPRPIGCSSGASGSRPSAIYEAERASRAALGDVRYEAYALRAIGLCHAELGDDESAIEACARAQVARPETRGQGVCRLRPLPDRAGRAAGWTGRSTALKTLEAGLPPALPGRRPRPRGRRPARDDPDPGHARPARGGPTAHRPGHGPGRRAGRRLAARRRLGVGRARSKGRSATSRWPWSGSPTPPSCSSSKAGPPTPPGWRRSPARPPAPRPARPGPRPVRGGRRDPRAPRGRRLARPRTSPPSPASSSRPTGSTTPSPPPKRPWTRRRRSTTVPERSRPGSGSRRSRGGRATGPAGLGDPRRGRRP